MVAGRNRAAHMRWAGLVLALSACAAGGPIDPVAPLDPVRLERESVAGADGTRLALSEWEPGGTPRAAILALHGFGSYGPNTFREAAGYWAAQGIRTYAYDQRGFGRNVSRGRWPGAEALIGDLAAVSAAVHQRDPCLPLTVIGHSMGGGVVLAAAGQGRLTAEQAVLAAPAIWGNAYLSPVYRAAAWIAAVTVPEKRFTGEGVVRIQASDNIPYLRSLATDPAYLGRPSAREIMGLVRLMDIAVDAAPGARIPTILLLGAKDEIVQEEDVQEVFGQIPGATGVIRYPEGWHLLFNDLAAERVWTDMANLALTAPAPAGCSG